VIFATFPVRQPRGVRRESWHVWI